MSDMEWLDDLEQERFKVKKNFKIKSISTGYDELNDALGVRGIPIGKIIDIAGGAGVGKTALTLDIIKNAQDKDKTVLYFDIDREFEAQFAQERGVDCTKLMVYQPEPNTKNIIQAIEMMVKDNLVDVIVFDTVSSLRGSIIEYLPKLQQLAAEYYTTFLLLSQVRADRQGHYRTVGMGALNTYCDIRMMLSVKNAIKYEGMLIGKNIDIDIYANRLFGRNKTDIELYI